MSDQALCVIKKANVIMWNVELFALKRYMNLCNIYTKDEVPRQHDYNLPEYYPNGAVRSKCALRRLPVYVRFTFNYKLFWINSLKYYIS